MLIGLDAIPLTEPKTGVGHHTIELARALAEASPDDEFQLLYPSRYSPLAFDAGDDAPRPLPANLAPVRVRVGALGRRWWAFGLPRHLRRARFALFHGMNYEVPLWGRCPTVVTIHDLSLVLHPHLHEARRVRRARRRLLPMARRAAAVITVSESVRREVCEHLGIAPEKVFTVYNAPRRCFRPATREQIDDARARLGIEPEFLLAVGTIEPRKNLSALVRAFEEVVRHQPHARRVPQLVIAGRTGWLNEDFFARVRGSSLAGRILFTGYVSDEDLRALYSACRVFVYPSTYEGFGLPPLEAMACGAPVVASRIPAIVETAGDSAARLVTPDAPGALASAILELLNDENARHQLAVAGQARAACFTWTRAARETLDVYREALKDG